MFYNGLMNPWNHMLISWWHSLQRQRPVEFNICQLCLRLSFQANSWQGLSQPRWWKHSRTCGIMRRLDWPDYSWNLGTIYAAFLFFCDLQTCNKTCNLNCFCSVLNAKKSGRNDFGLATHALWTGGGAVGLLYTFHVVVSNTPLRNHHCALMPEACVSKMLPNSF